MLKLTLLFLTFFSFSQAVFCVELNKLQEKSLSYCKDKYKDSVNYIEDDVKNNIKILSCTIGIENYLEYRKKEDTIYFSYAKAHNRCMSSNITELYLKSCIDGARFMAKSEKEFKKEVDWYSHITSIMDKPTGVTNFPYNSVLLTFRLITISKISAHVELYYTDTYLKIVSNTIVRRAIR